MAVPGRTDTGRAEPGAVGQGRSQKSESRSQNCEVRTVTRIVPILLMLPMLAAAGDATLEEALEEARICDRRLVATRGGEPLL